MPFRTSTPNWKSMLQSRNCLSHPSKCLFRTRKRSGSPSAPASTSWESHHFICMWSPPDTGHKPRSATAWDSKPCCKHAESWLCDQRPWEEANCLGDVFVSGWLWGRKRGLSCATVLPVYEPTFLFWPRWAAENHSKIKLKFLRPQGSFSFSFCEHIED